MRPADLKGKAPHPYIPVDTRKGPRHGAGGLRTPQKKEGSALRGRDALSSHGLHRSTFGEEGLNCRVRNGTG